MALNFKKPLPPADVLRSLLEYDSETGRLYWKRRDASNCDAPNWFNKRFAGKEAFTAKLCRGYRVGLIFGKTYQAHRVIWAMITGDDPGALDVDHINGDTGDNRASNLRLATNAQNQANKGKTRRGKSSRFKGVSYVKRDSCFAAFIREDGVLRYIGSFKCEAAAAISYARASYERYGEYSFASREMGIGQC